jgi:AraC family transcriptional regulator
MRLNLAKGFPRETNAFRAMSRLLQAPPPLAPIVLACRSQLTRRWLRGGFDGYAPGMAGHLIATYHGRRQQCAWTLGKRRLADQLRPGTVTVIAEGHDGYWSLAGPVEVSHVYLTNERLLNCAGLVAEVNHVEILDRVGFEDPVSAHILGILSDDDVLGDPGARLLVDRAVDLLCLQLLRRHNAAALPRSSPPARGRLATWRLGRVTDYMLEHLDRPIGLEELAAQVGLSRYHFATAFRITTGRTPHVWLTEQRMARARQLLGDPALSISEVALAVGYATPSAFAASFRKIVGMSPSNFRALP